jgi:ABC-type amino acid transport substrate-binding protein
VELTPEEKAFIAAHPVITFSDSDWRPLSIVVGGHAQGLFHDYFGLISQRTGLAFRFEPQGDGRDFQLVLDALRERRIDMIDGTGRHPSGLAMPCSSAPTCVFPGHHVPGDTPVSSLEALSGRRVAVGRGGTAHEYLKEHGKNLTIIPAEDHTEALSMVATGRADAAVENLAVAAHAIRMAGLVNVKISELLDYSFEIYSLVRSDWPLLASILKKAQDSVTETERGALLAKWLPVYKERLEGEAIRHEPAIPGIGAAVALTDREREYLNHKKALAYCIDPDWAPIEHIDENGRHVGMTADFLELMSARLGAPMVLVPTPSWSQTLVAIKDGRCDFLPAAGDTRQRRRFLNFTSSYLRFPMVVATRAKVGFIDDPSALVGKSLGVINGYASLDILRAKYPDLQLLEVPSVTEGLRLVSEGKLFGFIDIVPVISQAIAKGHFSDLKIAGRLDAELDLSMASREDEPELNSLFQKAVNSLTKAEIDAITKKWLAVTFEQGFDYALLWKVLAGGSVVLFVVIWWNRKLARLNRTIRRAHEALDQTSRRLGALLDNAGQGFLTVDADGLVEPQYSQECRTIFGVAMAGVWLPEVLYPADLPARDLMAKNIRRILDEPDAYRRELYLSLMPKPCTGAGRPCAWPIGPWPAPGSCSSSHRCQRRGGTARRRGPGTQPAGLCGGGRARRTGFFCRARRVCPIPGARRPGGPRGSWRQAGPGTGVPAGAYLQGAVFAVRMRPGRQGPGCFGKPAFDLAPDPGADPGIRGGCARRHGRGRGRGRGCGRGAPSPGRGIFQSAGHCFHRR